MTARSPASEVPQPVPVRQREIEVLEHVKANEVAGSEVNVRCKANLEANLEVREPQEPERNFRQANLTR